MSRTPARVTQADVARCVRAAMQAGASGVEIRRNGSGEYLAGIMAKIAPTFSAEGSEFSFRRSVYKRQVRPGR